MMRSKVILVDGAEHIDWNGTLGFGSGLGEASGGCGLAKATYDQEKSPGVR